MPVMCLKTDLAVINVLVLLMAYADGNSLTKKKYTIHKDKRTWNDARTKCEESGGRLAMIDNAITQNVLIAFANHPDEFWKINMASDFWIGLNKEGPSSSIFRWDHCEELSSGSYPWDDPNGPQNLDSHHCVYVLDTLAWKTYKCDVQFQYLCEEDLGPCTYTPGSGSCSQATHEQSYTLVPTDAICKHLCDTEVHNNLACVMYQFQLLLVPCTLYFDADHLACTSPSGFGDAGIRSCFEFEAVTSSGSSGSGSPTPEINCAAYQTPTTSPLTTSIGTTTTTSSTTETTATTSQTSAITTETTSQIVTTITSPTTTASTSNTIPTTQTETTSRNITTATTTPIQTTETAATSQTTETTIAISPTTTSQTTETTTTTSPTTETTTAISPTTTSQTTETTTSKSPTTTSQTTETTTSTSPTTTSQTTETGTSQTTTSPTTETTAISPTVTSLTTETTTAISPTAISPTSTSQTTETTGTSPTATSQTFETFRTAALPTNTTSTSLIFETTTTTSPTTTPSLTTQTFTVQTTTQETLHTTVTTEVTTQTTWPRQANGTTQTTISGSYCTCGQRTCVAVKNVTEINQVVDQLIKQLKVDPSTTSSTRRKKESASDPRPSAQAAGYSGIILILITVGFFIFFDLVRIYTHFTDRPGNATCNYSKQKNV